jgi:hypothetical protein
MASEAIFAGEGILCARCAARRKTSVFAGGSKNCVRLLIHAKAIYRQSSADSLPHNSQSPMNRAASLFIVVTGSSDLTSR